MARNINGGTDVVAWTANPAFPPVTATDIISIALRFRTTQATANVHILSRWTSASRSGVGFEMNQLTANKLQIQAYNASAAQVTLNTTTSVNDGNWHTAVANFSAASGATNQLYLDGSLEASGNSSGSWTMAGEWLMIGDSPTAFWASPVVDVCDVGYWHGCHLSADDVAAYNKGFRPRYIRPHYLELDAPLIRETIEQRGIPIVSQIGGSVIAHPRVIG